MKTTSSNKKVREIVTMVKEKKLVPRPEFQRRLVWTRDDKNHFLDSVLRGYPFPEIYLADGEVDLETGEGTQLLVDGLQRVNTLVQYFDGDPELALTVLPYRSLSEIDKRTFLQYDITVRDLGSIDKDEIIAAFKRLNATSYSLLDIEVNNARYAGVLKKFCEKISTNKFFHKHKVFNVTDYRRMGDLRYALLVVGTMLQGYFNRDDEFEALLDSYNDDFPMMIDIESRVQATFDFIDECGFGPKSRAWKKADLFTLLIEVDTCLSGTKEDIQPSIVVENVTKFYDAINPESIGLQQVSSIYYKAALQASNDRINRLRRGIVMGGLLRGHAFNEIYNELDDFLLT